LNFKLTHYPQPLQMRKRMRSGQQQLKRTITVNVSDWFIAADVCPRR